MVLCTDRTFWNSPYENILGRPFFTEIMVKDWNPGGWYRMSPPPYSILSPMNGCSHRFAEALLHPKKNKNDYNDTISIDLLNNSILYNIDFMYIHGF
jgi:hypothetical protein